MKVSVPSGEVVTPLCPGPETTADCVSTGAPYGLTNGPIGESATPYPTEYSGMS